MPCLAKNPKQTKKHNNKNTKNKNNNKIPLTVYHSIVINAI